jgi:hypothetical protein
VYQIRPIRHRCRPGVAPLRWTWVDGIHVTTMGVSWSERAEMTHPGLGPLGGRRSGWSRSGRGAAAPGKRRPNAYGSSSARG